MNISTLPASEKSRRGFYPTPQSVAERLLSMVDWHTVESILEPSAGKGDLAIETMKRTRDFTYCRAISEKERISRVNMDCIELDQTLRDILDGKGFRVVHDDFLSYNTQKRYNLIVMNPPFDMGAQHLLKALSMQKHGGQVACILNAQTLLNPCNETRRRLVKRLEEIGAKCEYLSEAFSKAERKTNVDTVLIYANIPSVDPDSSIMEDLKNNPPYQEAETPEEIKGLVHHDVIESWVNAHNYEVAVGLRLIDEFCAAEKILRKDFDEDNSSVLMLNLTVNGYKAYSAGDKDKNAYIRLVRGKYWRMLFRKPEFVGKLTSNLVEELDGMVEKLLDYEFSVYNILTIAQKMNAKIINGVEQTIVKLFDSWTAQYWNEESPNRHYFNGWATNDCFRVKQKVIISMRTFDEDFHSIKGEFRSYRAISAFEDIEKVFNFLDCGQTQTAIDYREVFREVEKTGNTKNLETKYFFVTFYKKGTAHLTFKDDALLEKFNIFAGRNKGWLPPNYGKKRYRDMTKAEQHVVDSFHGKDAEDRYNAIVAHSDYYLQDGNNQLSIGG